MNILVVHATRNRDQCGRKCQKGLTIYTHNNNTLSQGHYPGPVKSMLKDTVPVSMANTGCSDSC